LFHALFQFVPAGKKSTAAKIISCVLGTFFSMPGAHGKQSSLNASGNFLD